MLKIKSSSPRMISLIVALSFFMEAVNSTVVNTSIPAISQSLQVDPLDLKIVLISYLLSLSIFIPISGWLADQFGAKRIFTTALCIFTISSFGCGFSDNLTELIIARFIQGLGGALGLPVGRLILLRTFGREQFITAMNLVAMVAALGMMLGPVIGGIITHHFSWQWIFWVNIPVGIMAILLSYYYLHSEQLKHVPALDSLGFILFGASLAGVTFSLSELSKTTINYYIALSILCCSLLLLRAYSKHSKQQKYPIIKTTLLKLRTFRVSILGNLFSRLGFGGLPFLIPLFLQLILGYSAQLSGLLFMPIALGVVFAKPCTLFILRTFGYKRFLIVNTLFASCITGMFSCINSHTPLYIIGLLTFVYGFIVTLHYSALNSLAYSNISAKQLSSATSIMGTLQQLAQSFGIAVSAILIHVFSFIYSTELTAGIFQYTFFS